MSNKKLHIHKYERRYIGGRRVVKDENGKKHLIDNRNYEVFKCVLPGCNSFKERELAIGSASLCWVCNEPLELDAENTRKKRPTHTWCRKIFIKEDVA